MDAGEKGAVLHRLRGDGVRRHFRHHAPPGGLSACLPSRYSARVWPEQGRLAQPRPLPGHGRLRSGRRFPGQALAARDVADGGSVGVSATAPAQDRGRVADLVPVRRLPARGGLVLRLIGTALAAAGLAAAQPQALTVGHSVRARPIVAYERGDRSAPVTLVVGVTHGSEPAGLSVIRQLRTMPLPAGVHLWLVPTVNPDGLAAGTRQNAHGVDLNRNWPVAWERNGPPRDGYYSGPPPLSEPEKPAMRAFILRRHPSLTVWYHQPPASLGAGEPGDARVHPPRSPCADGLVPPAARRRLRLRLSRRRPQALRAPQRTPVQAPRGPARRGHPVGAQALSRRRPLRGRVSGRPDHRGDRAPQRERGSGARAERAISSLRAGSRRSDPRRSGVDGPTGGRLPAGARVGEAAAAPLLPLRLVFDLNERDGAPA